VEKLTGGASYPNFQRVAVAEKSSMLSMNPKTTCGSTA
jgi:hypothetical protein